MATLSQRSFSAGELTPALYARTDLTKYQAGLRTLRNFFVMRHGGATNRPGTKFIGEVKDSAKNVRMIPFIFSSEDAYILEFGDEYMRVIRDGAYVTNLTLTITGISNANPGVVTYTGSDPSAGDEFAFSQVEGAIGAYINGRNFKVANVNTGSNTFELQTLDGTNFDTTSLGSYSSGGSCSRIYTVTTVYDHEDLAEIQYAQSADEMRLAHPSYPVKKLSRSAHDNWTFTDWVVATTYDKPSGVSVSGTNGDAAYWTVTSVSESGEESLGSKSLLIGADTEPSSGAPRTVTWNDAEADHYNVYRTSNSAWGLIGSAGTELEFVDTGIIPDTSISPPYFVGTGFGSEDEYPGVIAYFQQRFLVAATNNNPATIYPSRIGLPNNYLAYTPLTDSCPFILPLTGKQVSRVRHLLDLGKLVIFTPEGEFVAEGNSAGVITPTEVNLKQHSYHGSSTLSPIVIDGSALFVQARGSIIRDIGFDFQSDGYRGNDLTIFSTHLVDGHTISDWAYQKTPHSLVWCVRDDGILICLTYIREQQILGWSRHDFENGTVENVCSIPEGTEDAVYLVIKRTINGSTKRYVERFSNRIQSDVKDFIFMDSALSYDGRNTDTDHSMTLSSSGGWTYEDEITVTSSESVFESDDVGNAIHLTGEDGTLIKVEITTYTSATVVSGRPQRTVPESMRSTAITDWAKAVDSLSGLWHLEGEDVSVIADGYVKASPKNSAYDTMTVTNGAITLDKPCTVIHVGLPITSDLEPLDIDTAQGETLADKYKIVQSVTMHVQDSRGIWVGPKPPSDDDTDPLENLVELPSRSDEPMSVPPNLRTEPVEIAIPGEWNSHGRIFVRQVDPLPLTVSSIMPAGSFPFRG